nr:hypothetical protein [Tanacetum cinerariifolium]
MRLDVLKFSRDDPDRWHFVVTEYFSLLNTTADQHLRFVELNLEDNIDHNVEWISCNEPEPQAENIKEAVYEEVDLEDFDSEINSDDEEAGRKKYLRMLCKSLKPVYGKTNTENFYVIQTYPTKDMIKDMVTRVAIRTRRELQLTRNDKGRVRAECRGIVPVFSNNYPNEDGLGVGLSGGDGPSGSKSKASGLKLKERNPYTTVEIDVERIYKPESMTRQFIRIYILTAIGVDPNYGIYPLAYAIVESENKQSWLWFLDCLGDDLELFRNSNFTFGLIPALAETFPSAEHRYCLKHIYDNMKLQWRGKQFKDLLWRCATATTVSYFNKNMEELKGIPESWVHFSYWLATWEEMYRFKINPCNGHDLWPQLDIPITYTPPDYHRPTGRPPKKRKKNVAELFDSMVKNGKLSRGVNPYALAFNPSQTTQSTVNPSSPPVNPSQTYPTIRHTKANASRFSPAKNATSRTSGATGPSGSGKRQVRE